MKVIFLDIDEVLNSIQSRIALKEKYTENELTLDPVCVGLLKDLCQNTEAKIVISSTWRLKHDIEWFKAYFKNYFDWDNFPVIDMLPYFGIRHSLISAYITEHQLTSYVIIDDEYVLDCDDYDHTDIKPFVKCDSSVGFNIYNYYDALMQLGANDPEYALDIGAAIRKK